MSWRHKNFKNPYGDEWYMSGCQHQYNLGEAYELGFNDCLKALDKQENYEDWLQYLLNRRESDEQD